MKKLLTVFLSLTMIIFSLVGCSSSAPASSSSASSEAEQTEEPANSEYVDGLLVDFEEELMKQLGDKPESGKNEKIGVLIISTSNEFWANMKTCYEAAAEDLGITVDVQGASAEDDKDGQLDALMTMADMDYDAIIVSPIDGTNLISGIVKCNENEIPVINLGPGVDVEALEEAGGHLDGKITVNFEDQGKTVAEDMVSKLSDGGQVAILEGLAGAGQSVGRTKGATDVFESTDGIELVASQACDWDATKAYDATKDILQANPDLKGIFACNDVMALAATEALAAEGKDDVLVYGVDYTASAKEAIKEGTMTGSMSYSSVIYTKAALMMGMKLAQGNTIDDTIYLPLTLITGDNVDKMDGWK